MPRKAAQSLSDARLRATKRQPGATLRLRDGATPGLSFLVRPGGRREFQFAYSLGGSRRAVVLGEYRAASASVGRASERARTLVELPDWKVAPDGLTLAEARSRADRVRAFVRAGGDPAAERLAEREQAKAAAAAERVAAEIAQRVAAGEPPPGSFGELAQSWLAYQTREGRSRESVRAAELVIESDLAPLRDRPAGEIQRRDLWSIAERVAAGHGERRAKPGKGAPVAARNLLKLVGRIYSFALDTDFPGVQANPAARIVKRFGGSRRRDRVLSAAELRAFWQATESEPPILRGFARLLLLCPIRRDELLGARWQEIQSDEFGVWLAVPATRMKMRAAHRAPLSRLARAELELLARVRDPEFLFPGRSAGTHMVEVWYFRKRLQERVAALMPEPSADPRLWTWHDLRRTARTLLAEAGGSDTVAELMLAHTPPALDGVAGAYNVHRYRRELQDAAELLAERVRRIVGDEPPATVLPFYQRSPRLSVGDVAEVGS